MAKVIVKCRSCGKSFRIQKRYKEYCNNMCTDCFGYMLDVEAYHDRLIDSYYYG